MSALGLLLVWLIVAALLAIFAGEFLDETAARKLGPPKGRR